MNSTRTRNNRLYALLFLALFLVRVPFFLTHHVQEDAYISLRCAENLAESGVYGFNPGERVSSSTSHLYVFLAAAVRLLVGHAAFVPAMLVINTLLFLTGTGFLARGILRDEKQRLLFWVLASLLPVSLLISTSGMETSLLIFVIGLSFYLLSRPNRRGQAFVLIGLFPWVRPDALAYALLLLFWDALRRKRLPWGGMLALLLGMGGLLAFNQLYFGTLLQQSIQAKMLMRHAFSLDEFVRNLGIVFLGSADGGIFAPIRTKYLAPAGGLFLLFILTSMILYLWRVRHDPEQLLSGLTLASLALVVPLAYAYGGVLYQWYFWASNLFGYLFALALITLGIGQHRRMRSVWSVVVSLFFMAGLLAQGMFSFAWGKKEYAYRGGIGVWLAEHARPEDRMLLEPAGYIPYYSGLYTYDEVGLVTPQVVTYRLAYGPRWWPEFVEDFKPQWLVQRGQIADFTTYQGYHLSAEEQDWFRLHYDLVARFAFDPASYTSNAVLERLLTLGEADNYYLFRYQEK